MGDEFQAGICSGNWWNSSRSGLSVGSCSSPCSTALNDIGSLGWPSETRSSCEETTASVSDSSMVFQQTQKQSQGPDSVGSGGGGGSSGGGEVGGGGGGGGNILMDPTTLQMMGFGASSLTMDWNQALLRGNGRSAETTFHSMLQDDQLSSGPKMESPPHQTHQVHKEWSPKSSFSDGGEDSSTLNPFNNKQVFPALDQQHQHQHQQQRLSPSSGDCTVSNQQVMVSSFPSFPCNSASLLQGLFDQQEPQLQLQQHRHQHSSFDTNPSPNYHINAGEFASPLLSQSPAWTKFPAFLRTSQPKQQQQHQPQLHFSNNTPYWNASTAPMNDARSSFFPSSHTQFLSPVFDEKPSCSTLTALSTAKSGTMEVRDSGSVAKKVSTEPAYKRPRIETPTPLPTFKVRKEKLGDRITALQQLVSPFGKTDTASVLFEAIEYIKLLHDQVSVLSTPYLKNGAPAQHQQNSDKSKDGEEHKQDLRNRGLCLVPISSTFPVTNETAADFWTPTFGGSYR